MLLYCFPSVLPQLFTLLLRSHLLLTDSYEKWTARKPPINCNEDFATERSLQTYQSYTARSFTPRVHLMQQTERKRMVDSTQKLFIHNMLDHYFSLFITFYLTALPWWRHFRRRRWDLAASFWSSSSSRTPSWVVCTHPGKILFYLKIRSLFNIFRVSQATYTELYNVLTGP